jgi:hypothetical protein
VIGNLAVDDLVFEDGTTGMRQAGISSRSNRLRTWSPEA